MLVCKHYMHVVKCEIFLNTDFSQYDGLVMEIIYGTITLTLGLDMLRAQCKMPGMIGTHTQSSELCLAYIHTHDKHIIVILLCSHMYMTTSHYFIFRHACTSFHWVHVCARSGLIIFMHVNALEVFPGSLL